MSTGHLPVFIVSPGQSPAVFGFPSNPYTNDTRLGGVMGWVRKCYCCDRCLP